MYVVRELKVGVKKETQVTPDIRRRNGILFPFLGIEERGLPNEGEGATAGARVIRYKMF